MVASQREARRKGRTIASLSQVNFRAHSVGRTEVNGVYKKIFIYEYMYILHIYIYIYMTYLCVCVHTWFEP